MWRQRAGNNQALHILKRVNQVVHFLLVGRVHRSTGVHHIELAVLSVKKYIHARNAIGPHGVHVDALGLGAFDDKAAGKASKKAKNSGVFTKVMQSERNIQTLAVRTVDGVARARDAVGLQTIACNVVVDRRIGGKGVDHDVSFVWSTRRNCCVKPLLAYQIEDPRKPCPKTNKHDKKRKTGSDARQRRASRHRTIYLHKLLPTVDLSP